MKTRYRVGLAVGASVLMLAPAAMALTIIGTEGDDRIIGSRADDRISALEGNDRVRALGGDDWVHAGTGDDRVGGDNGADNIRGKEGNDLVRGGDGKDIVRAGQGVDVVAGGHGKDVVWAFAHRDVGVEGVDRLFGGARNDKLRARDGEPDQINCGGGRRDLAILDFVDVIVDATEDDPGGSCEAVFRATPPPHPPEDEG